MCLGPANMSTQTLSWPQQRLLGIQYGVNEVNPGAKRPIKAASGFQGLGYIPCGLFAGYTPHDQPEEDGRKVVKVAKIGEKQHQDGLPSRVFENFGGKREKLSNMLKWMR